MFYLEYEGTAAIKNEFGMDEVIDISGECEVDAPISQYGRIAQYAKDKNIILKNELKGNKKIKGILKLAGKSVKFTGNPEVLQKYLDEKASETDAWYKAIQKNKHTPAQNMKYAEEMAFLKREKEILEKMLESTPAPKGKKS